MSQWCSEHLDIVLGGRFEGDETLLGRSERGCFVEAPFHVQISNVHICVVHGPASQATVGGGGGFTVFYAEFCFTELYSKPIDVVLYAPP
jgi:hypothetical protein